jgi:hypothetical protein
VIIFCTFRLFIEKGHPMTRRSIHVTNRVHEETDAKTLIDTNENFKISEIMTTVIIPKGGLTEMTANSINVAPTIAAKMALTR